MGCRYPGGARTPEEFWELIRSGTDAMSAFPADRGWDAGCRRTRIAPTRIVRARAGLCMRRGSSIPGSSGSARGRRWRWTRSSGCCWRCAGRHWSGPGSTRRRCAAARPGCSPGPTPTDYGAGAGGRRRGGERGSSDGYLLTGNAASVVSGRVAYVLGLEGPAVSVDTACSSSLVALHLACQALRAGECTMALAGGVTVMATPATFSEFSRQGGLAADGRCKAFGAGGRRHRAGPRARGAGGGAAVGCAAERAPGARGRAGQRGESGRGQQRADRAERPLPAAGDPGGAGQCRAVARRGGRGGGARHRDRAGGSDRGAGAAGHLRAGAAGGPAAVAGVGEVEHRAHPGGGGRGRGDQDGHGHAARGAAADAARRGAVAARGLVGRARCGC